MSRLTGLRLLATAWLALVLATAAPAGAQYPERAVRLIVPFAPWGGADLTSRLIAQRLPDALGRQVIVDNRAGGASNIGTEAAARSAADGHTLLLATLSMAVNASLFPKLPFNALKDFEPVSLLVTVPLVVVVHPSLPVQTIQDLIALAKSRPGTLNYASGGIGSANHVAGELFKHMTGVQIAHVPYKGGGPAIADILGGHVSLLFGTLTSTHEFAKSGRLRALATTGGKRSVAAPELPTVAESGLPGYLVEAWYGVMAPTGTPRPIIDRLAVELARIVQAPDVRETLRAQGTEAVGSTPEEFARYLRAEIEKWSKMVKAQGLRNE